MTDTTDPQADRAALRDCIAAALYERERPPRDPHWPDAFAMDREVFEPMADAVLAVLPATVDRAAILRGLASSIQSGDVPFNTEAAEAALKNGGPFALIAYVQLAIGKHLRRMAGEAQQPETQADAHPPTVTWEIESPRRGTWASWGTTYDEHDWARERFQDAIGHVPARQFRLVRATTVYVVEAEHAPAAVSQPGKEA